MFRQPPDARAAPNAWMGTGTPTAEPSGWKATDDPGTHALPTVTDATSKHSVPSRHTGAQASPEAVASQGKASLGSVRLCKPAPPTSRNGYSLVKTAVSFVPHRQRAEGLSELGTVLS